MEPSAVQCVLCNNPSEAVEEVEYLGTWQPICHEHSQWTEDELSRAFFKSLDPKVCVDCGAKSRTFQPRKGRYYPVCNECDRRFALEEMNWYNGKPVCSNDKLCKIWKD